VSRNEFDGARLALFQGLFAACAEEMGVTLMRTAHSPNIKERLDHSCAVFDGGGRLVAQAAHIPVHLGSMPRAVEAVLERCVLGRGDVVLLNDPYAGGTHLPDLTLVSPVFASRSGRRPDFLVASRAHHADIGGGSPGSMGLARDIYGEGLRLPPVHLVRGGRIVPDVLALVLGNVRTARERRADLLAQIGAQTTGERRLAELIRGHGLATLNASSSALIDYAARCVRAALAALPRGRWRFADALDDDGIDSRPVRIAVKLETGRGRLRVDFTGSSPATAGPLNAPRAVTEAAVTYAVRVALGGDFPVNHGSLSGVEIVTTPGSVVHAIEPAAVVGGNVETSQRIVDVVLGALARALPGRIPAASYGTMSNLLAGGRDPRTGEAFSYYETLAGGHGAGPTWPGESAMQAHMTNTRNTPVESFEHAYPLRVVATRIRRGSGGRGTYRGGDGIERTLELLAPARVTVLSDRRRTRPYGLAGGAPGAPGANSVRTRAGSAPRRMPGKFVVDLPAGALLTVASPGGGGHGRRARRIRR
jgi:N-methylhydantoinase B